MVLLLAATGCGVPIGARRMDPRTVHRTLTQNALSTATPSWATSNLLFERDLLDLWDDHPERAIAELHELITHGVADQDDVFALAELSFLHGERAHQRPYFLAAALYAWTYLFPDRGISAPSPYDPRFRLACDLYNRGITAGLDAGDGKTVAIAGGSHPLPFGQLEMTLDPESLRWGKRTLVGFVPVAEFQVLGLHTRYRWPGLGAPLAAAAEATDREEWDLVAPRVRVPVTALLRVDDATAQLRSGNVHAVLEIHSPGGKDTTTIGGATIPLEVESTATLAAQLGESRLWDRELKGFFQRIALGDLPRLAAVRPYQRGRIPVIFVHGTASSAGRWAEMVNQLDNDPAVRDAYQFWFFTYDTGSPTAYSAMVLRETLVDAVRRLDPDATDPALRRMVLVGHSQGGLLVRAMVTESGDTFWNNVSRKPLDELDLSDEARDLLRRGLFFHPVPFVRRVVFIATPHRGSYVAGNWLAHLVARLIKLPLDVARVGTDIVSRNQDAMRFAFSGRMTAVDAMTPGHPFVKSISSLPLAPGVAAHSIIAVNADGQLADAEDGVVAYSSAHVEGVESELVVRSGHSCQSNPRTIAEVRRILLAHLAAAPSLRPAPEPVRPTRERQSR